MRFSRAVVMLAAFTFSTAAVVASGQRATAPGGFAELHRAKLSDEHDRELVMGLIERDGESRSGKHHHPGGEFGFVVSGAVVITSGGVPDRTLNAGDSFYQPPGEWHVVTTGGAGAKTVVFRVIESDQPMVVPVE